MPRRSPDHKCLRLGTKNPFELYSCSYHLFNCCNVREARLLPSFCWWYFLVTFARRTRFFRSMSWFSVKRYLREAFEKCLHIKHEDQMSLLSYLVFELLAVAIGSSIGMNDIVTSSPVFLDLAHLSALFLQILTSLWRSASAFHELLKKTKKTTHKTSTDSQSQGVSAWKYSGYRMVYASVQLLWRN